MLDCLLNRWRSTRAAEHRDQGSVYKRPVLGHDEGKWKYFGVKSFTLEGLQKCLIPPAPYYKERF